MGKSIISMAMLFKIPMKMAIEIVDLPIKNCALPIKNGDLPMKNCKKPPISGTVEAVEAATGSACLGTTLRCARFIHGSHERPAAEARPRRPLEPVAPWESPPEWEKKP